MTNIIIFGECMLELTSAANDHFKQSFAGDVFSLATYLTRLAPTIQAELLSAVGRDPISEQLIQQLDNEGVGTRLIARHRDKMLGLYIIRNDDEGEREFLYWRSDSAARQCLKLQKLTDIATPDYFYLSGISVAILDNEDQQTLLAWLTQLRQQGCKIIFDPNHRPKLWARPEHAKNLYEQLFSLSHIALPGMDDLNSLYHYTQPQEAIAWLKGLGCEEIIVKDGKRNIHYYSAAKTAEFTVTPVAKVVDATAAGDSFAAGFLACRLQGKSAAQAIDYACRISAMVLQHQGAIIPKQKFCAPSIPH